MLDKPSSLCYNIFMYIKKIKKKNGVTNSTYEYLHLVENIRTEKGPRQKLILNLGTLDIDPSQYKALAQRIEDILKGQQTLFQLDNNIEKQARQAADKIFRKQAEEISKEREKDFQDVDINSIQPDQVRTIGAEYVCNSIWNELGLNNFFTKNEVPESVIPVIEAVVLGRLIDAGSELHIKEWSENRSSIYELVGHPLRNALNSYYRATDRIYGLKDELERYLSNKEKDLFSLEEKYYFFDLTNSYFEGKCLSNSKAKYGRSKEKRSDCKLIAMGLVVDENGFAKCSDLFEGNRNETTTLESMIKALEEKSCTISKNKTIVMDAGIASDDNIDWLKGNGYHYIVVNRGEAPFEIDYEDMKIIKEDEGKEIRIEVKRYDYNDEVYILCRSNQKQKKEEGIRTRIEELLLTQLEYLRSGLSKSRRMKKYTKVVEAVGRLKEKYSSVSKLYNITVIPESDNSNNVGINAIDIRWEKKEELYNREVGNEGSYILRSDRIDLGDKEIWNIYIMLRNIESSFLNMKSHLGLRPNFHQKEDRIDAHMFISVLAYHILHIIEYKLRLSGDNRRWSTVRDILSTHARLTISFDSKDKDGEIINKKIRLNTMPETEHMIIYKRLSLSGNPLPKKILNVPKV